MVGGVEPRVPDASTARSRSTSGDRQAARGRRGLARGGIGAGASGPRIEEQLAAARPDAAPLPAVVRAVDARRLDRDALRRPLRHALTHIDDFVESIRAVTPARRLESRAAARARARARRPTACCSARKGSWLITEAWVRLQPRPTHRASAPVRFADSDGAEARPRALAQSGCTRATAASSTRSRPGAPAPTTADALLLLGFESADHPGAWIERAVESAAITAATWEARSARRGPGGATARGGRVPPLPYLRDRSAGSARSPRRSRPRARGSRFPALHAGVREAVRTALGGPAGHLPVHARVSRRPGAVLHGACAGTEPRGVAQWEAIKAAAGRAIPTRTARSPTTMQSAATPPVDDRQRPDRSPRPSRGQGRARPGGPARSRRAPSSVAAGPRPPGGHGGSASWPPSATRG